MDTPPLPGVDRIKLQLLGSNKYGLDIIYYPIQFRLHPVSPILNKPIHADSEVPLIFAYRRFPLVFYKPH